MTADIFATQITGTNANQALSGGKSGALNGSLGGALGGLLGADFLDLLLGQVSVEENTTADGKQVILKTDAKISAADLKDGDSATIEQGDLDTLLQEKGDLALLKLALLGQAVNENNEEITAGLAELKIEKLDNRANQLAKIIAHLTNGLAAGVEQSGDIDAVVTRLQERIENLETNLELFRTNSDAAAGDEPFALLIATGLNPAQLTSITKRIEDVENKLGRELTAEDLIAGVGNIIPTNNTDEPLSSAELLALANEVGADKNADDLMSLAEQAQARNASFNPNSLEAQSAALGEAYVGNAANGKAGAASNGDFNALKNKLGKINTQSNLLDINAAPSPLISGFDGSVALPENWQSYFNDVFDALGINIDSGLPVSPTMLAAHISTSIAQAGQAHAATQMVASQMTKSAQTGASSEMTIQLDPPELGRVEIKLEFGSDKQVKAHLVVEKPETFLLLQRDAGALERALQNAGMDTDNSALSFELAAQDFAFGGDGERGGNGSDARGKDGENAGEDEDIINTTMTWDVDPDTGHVHYMILA